MLHRTNCNDNFLHNNVGNTLQVLTWVKKLVLNLSHFCGEEGLILGRFLEESAVVVFSFKWILIWLNTFNIGNSLIFSFNLK